MFIRSGHIWFFIVIRSRILSAIDQDNFAVNPFSVLTVIFDKIFFKRNFSFVFFGDALNFVSAETSNIFIYSLAELF